MNEINKTNETNETNEINEINEINERNEINENGILTQEERLDILNSELTAEQPRYAGIEMPKSLDEKKRLFRALCNVRMPMRTSEKFLRLQDEYLRGEISEKGITDVKDLIPIRDKLYLWQGDITTLKCGAIVNAANSGMLGCFVPCHGCIDNAIHTYAGVRLRAECAERMRGGSAPTGSAMATGAYNLPCDFVIHTVGPIIDGRVTRHDREMLASCYRACLEAADEHGIKTIAFCCISTGEFRFPNRLAAEIALRTVRECLPKTNIEGVIFNVFKDEDYKIYRELLGAA